MTTKISDWLFDPSLLASSCWFTIWLEEDMMVEFVWLLAIRHKRMGMER